MPKVTFQKEQKTIEVPKGTNLRAAAQKAEIQIYRGPARLLNCRGDGKCKTCRVKVTPDGQLSPRTALELPRDPRTIFQIIDHRDLIGWRLACQAKVHGDIVVTTQD